MDGSGLRMDNLIVRFDRLLFGAVAVLGATATLGAATLALVSGLAAGALWWVAAGPGALYAAALFAYWRRPSHPAVRCLLVAASLLAASTLFEYWLRLSAGAAGPVVWLLDALYVATEIGASVAGLGFFALFPVGRPERPFERVIVRSVVTTAVALPVLLMASQPVLPVNPFSFPDFPDIANSSYLPWLEPISELVFALYVGYWMAALPVAVVMLGLRYRRSGFEQRRQIRWLLFGVVVGVLGTVPWVFGLTWLGALLGVPCMLVTVACIVIALLDAGLLDVDVIIRKSLVYATLWLLIALGYVAVAAGLGLAASQQLPVTAAILLAILSTLLFQPARRRLERLAERWVFGRRASHYEIVTLFGDALETVGDLDGLIPKLAETVRTGLGLRWATVRLDRADGSPPAAMPEGRPGAGSAPEVVVPLVHHGESFGAIECGPKWEGPFTEADHQLLATLARQAAAVVHNVRLRTQEAQHLAEISRRTAELTESRARLVQVQDAERRRLQHQLHDGVQQSVAALSGRLGLARNQLRRGDDRAAATLGELQADIDMLLDELRDLAHTIRPSVLTDSGLLDAIEAQAARLPIPVTINASRNLRGVRFPADIEDAAWYGLAEAMTNALKHSTATRLDVRLAQVSGRLELEVADDGSGFDPPQAARFGLTALADRMAVLGGQLVVDSAPGDGARVRMLLPLPAPTEGDGRCASSSPTTAT